MAPWMTWERVDDGSYELCDGHGLIADLYKRDGHWYVNIAGREEQLDATRLKDAKAETAMRAYHRLRDLATDIGRGESWT